jgi:K(+)-stimulated pyrophosphate-energized sodium pump
LSLTVVSLLLASPAFASEAELKIPDLSLVNFGVANGHNLLLVGLVICVLGMVFGLVQYMQIRNLPVQKAMREISELIWETCKTYLITQGKFILM